MARYRKISVQMWNDEKFLSLSTEGMLAFIFVITHPQMQGIGAMRATVEGLTHELGKGKDERFRKGFEEPFRKGLLKVDRKAGFLCAPNFLRHNRPENPNVVKGWVTVPELLPQCKLQDWYFERVGEFVKDMGQVFLEALPKAFRKGMANQEQLPKPLPEQLPEQQEQERAVKAGDSMNRGVKGGAALPRGVVQAGAVFDAMGEWLEFMRLISVAGWSGGALEKLGRGLRELLTEGPNDIRGYRALAAARYVCSEAGRADGAGRTNAVAYVLAAAVNDNTPDGAFAEAKRDLLKVLG